MAKFIIWTVSPPIEFIFEWNSNPATPSPRSIKDAPGFDLITPLIYLRDTALYTLPLGLKTILDQQGAGGGGEGRWEVIMAGTVITVLPMVILFAIFQRFFIEGIATQGRKG